MRDVGEKIYDIFATRPGIIVVEPNDGIFTVRTFGRPGLERLDRDCANAIEAIEYAVKLAERWALAILLTLKPASTAMEGFDDD